MTSNFNVQYEKDPKPSNILLNLFWPFLFTHNVSLHKSFNSGHANLDVYNFLVFLTSFSCLRDSFLILLSQLYPLYVKSIYEKI